MCTIGHEKVVQMLMDAGADVNAGAVDREHSIEDSQGDRFG
jgi:hypothetical protein